MSAPLTPELVQFEALAQVDDLVRSLEQFVDGTSAWEPLTKGRGLLRRMLARVDTLRSRLQAPLVVATFGGTGTGKSALVNALVGQECTTSGRQRPTTTRPVLIVHPETDLGLLGLPIEKFQLVQVATPLLSDLVILDCPDPDTNEVETAGSNLALLHGLLPWCDVLLYVSTQQKYRSARVTAELVQAAIGCRLVFVQTNADLDSDIRDDWRKQLAQHYAVPEIFFIDSVRALQEQQQGVATSGEFSRLRELLRSELSAGRRAQIRRANLLDLTYSSLERCGEYCNSKSEAVSRLEAFLSDQERKQIEVMSGRLQNELLSSRQLWEKRLLQEVTTRWSLTPFSAILRTYASLGSLIASASFFRARSSVQLALLGAFQGARWLQARREELVSENRLEKATNLGLDDSILREAQVLASGYVRDAGLDPTLLQSGDFEQLKSEAQRVEGQFLGDAAARIDGIIAELAVKHSQHWARYVYEVLLGLMLVYVMGWPAYNFFVGHPIYDKPLVSSDFYIHGAVFTSIWALILVMVFTSRLRVGLVDRVAELARQMAAQRLSRGIFPKLEEECRSIRNQSDQLQVLSGKTKTLRNQLPSSQSLGKGHGNHGESP